MVMNRLERRKAESIKRKMRAMKPAARELAIEAGIELYDALAEKRKQETRSIFEKAWASKCDELYKRATEEQANRFAEPSRGSGCGPGFQSALSAPKKCLSLYG
jgi:hypothetical protein